jgi:hypothetical protein
MKLRFMMLAAAGLVLLLTACGPATPLPVAEATDTPTAAASPTPSDVATPTPVAEATETVPEPAAAFPTPNPNPECVAAPIPEDPNIPPVSADEWSQGPDDAQVTLIEYGDFQ